jgi:1-acyl-sn-glycerol-3-phosphate acyltransferase
MQSIVIDKPYRFVAPYKGRLIPKLLQWFVRPFLRRFQGIEEVTCAGLEHLRASLQAGHGVLLAPNHCRPCDPIVVNEMCRQAGTVPCTMASWHVFMQGRLQALVARYAGAFSVYREGMDRQALAAATEILVEGRRPLVLFPEGVVTRHNDSLSPMMEGTAFIARSAAKKRAEAGKSVVVHPAAIRYRFHGKIEQAADSVLADIETRLTWRPKRNQDLVARIYQVGEALLSLKEVEYTGRSQPGSIPERINRLIDTLLVPLEQEWLKGLKDGNTVARAKKLRIAILPDMVHGDIGEAERERRWAQLADIYLAQQMSHYLPDYLKSNPTPERILETVERFEEDLTDKCRVHRPMTAQVTVGPAILVSAARDRGSAEDPVMSALERQLCELLGI